MPMQSRSAVNSLVVIVLSLSLQKVDAISLQRDEEAQARLSERVRLVALAARVLDQEDLAGADDAAFPVARGDLHAALEVHDVLPPRRVVEVEIVIRLGLAEDNAVGGQALRQLAAAPLLGPLDLDVAEMRFAVGVGVEVVDAHVLSSRRKAKGERRKAKGESETSR